MTDHPSELDFDLALLEAPSEPMKAHLEACDACRAHLATLAGELAAFRSGDEPKRAARIITGKLAERRLFARIRRWVWLPASAAVAASVFFLVRPTPEIRTKGGPRVIVHVHDQAADRPWDGTPLHTGDAVQLEVAQVGDVQPRVRVFSVDPRCQVSLEADEPSPDAQLLVPAKWTLRGEEGGERLYVSFSKREVEPGELGAALEKAHACTSPSTPDLSGDGFVARGVSLRPWHP